MITDDRLMIDGKRLTDEERIRFHILMEKENADPTVALVYQAIQTASPASSGPPKLVRLADAVAEFSTDTMKEKT
jgi:hypothetical protein